MEEVNEAKAEIWCCDDVRGLEAVREALLPKKATREVRESMGQS